MHKFLSAPELSRDIPPQAVKPKRCRSAEELTSYSAPSSIQHPSKNIIPLIEKEKLPCIHLWHPFNECLSKKLMQATEKKEKYKIIAKFIRMYEYVGRCQILGRTDAVLNHRVPEKDILIMRKLLYEIVRFSLDRKYTAIKMGSLMNIYYSTYKFFKSSRWLNHDAVFDYFKETLFLHSAMDAPTAVYIFNQFDVEEVIKYFTETFLPVLVLFQIKCHPNWKLLVSWENESQTQKEEISFF